MKVTGEVVKPYWEMGAEELAAATREFDTESDPTEFRPLVVEKREIWERLQVGATTVSERDAGSIGRSNSR